MSILRFVILAACLYIPGVFAGSDRYTIDPTHTFPGFEISHLGFSVQRGRFNKTSGHLVMDPKADTGNIQVEIDAASISTGLDKLEEHLRGEDFFDVKRYPTITYYSDQFEFQKGQLVGLKGQLTMHGITKPVQLKVDHFHCGLNMINMKTVCGANATGYLKRSDFDVDKYAPMLADQVKIVIQVEATKD